MRAGGENRERRRSQPARSRRGSFGSCGQRRRGSPRGELGVWRQSPVSAVHKTGPSQWSAPRAAPGTIGAALGLRRPVRRFRLAGGRRRVHSGIPRQQGGLVPGRRNEVLRRRSDPGPDIPTRVQLKLGRFLPAIQLRLVVEPSQDLSRFVPAIQLRLAGSQDQLATPAAPLRRVPTSMSGRPPTARSCRPARSCGQPQLRLVVTRLLRPRPTSGADHKAVPRSIICSVSDVQAIHRCKPSSARPPKGLRTSHLFRP